MALTPPRASVLLPTRGPGVEAIRRVLSAVYGQVVGFPFEVLIVDSGSSPAELAAMAEFPARVERIPPEAFGHGRTRNRLAEMAGGEALLFLSQDARPADAHWMARLVAALDDAAVGGAYARQLPKPGADPLIRFFLEETYGPAPVRRPGVRSQESGVRGPQAALRPASALSTQHSALCIPSPLTPHPSPLPIADMFFSNVSSAIRRDTWRQAPFREDVVMSEDQYWARDALLAGWDVLYEPAARVFHSHNYSLPSLFRRNRLSGASLRGLIADSGRDISRRGLAYLARETAYLARAAKPHWTPYMVAYEAVKAAGFWWGMQNAQ